MFYCEYNRTICPVDRPAAVQGERVMNWMNRAVCMLLAGAILTVLGCATGKNSLSGQPTAAGKAAVVTVTLQGPVPTGASINTVDLTLNLPPGVTVQAAPTGLVAEGVMVPSGVAQGSLAAARFIPAAGPQPAQLRVALIKAVGFGAGEVATFHFDIKGTVPRPDDFSVAGLKVTDARGASLSGVTATLGLKIE
jgi:hypothetical protein